MAGHGITQHTKIYLEEGDSGLLPGNGGGEKKEERVLEAGLPLMGADIGGRKHPLGLVGRKGGVA